MREKFCVLAVVTKIGIGNYFSRNFWEFLELTNWTFQGIFFIHKFAFGNDFLMKFRGHQPLWNWQFDISRILFTFGARFRS